MKLKKIFKKFNPYGSAKIFRNPLYIDFESIRMGTNVKFLDGARIVDGTDGNSILYLGSNISFGYRCSIILGADIYIGDNCSFASDVFITSGNHDMMPDTIPYGNQKYHGGGVHIGEGVWIGEKVCILDGVHIGKYAIVGAGSIVTKNIPEYSLAIGNPAHIIKKYDVKEKKWKKVN